MIKIANYILCIVYCLKQLPLLLPLGEDDISMEQHRVDKASEINRADKVHPSAELLLDRQKRILTVRTKDLETMSTTELLVKYPWLKLPRLVRILSNLQVLKPTLIKLKY